MTATLSAGVRSEVPPDLVEKVAGAARYAADLIRPGTPVVGIVRSPMAHARLLGVDVGVALAIPGVLDVLTGDDFKGFRMGNLVPDQPVLAEEKVRYVGEPVAALIATSGAVLRRAINAVQVKLEALPEVFTADDAVTAPFAIHEHAPRNVAQALSSSRGDWESSVGRVEVWSEGVFEVQPAQHAYMEPYATFAEYQPSRITLHAPVHMPHLIRDEFRHWCESKGWEESLEFRTPYIGGSFGAKYEHAVHLICAEFARRLRRDVGLVMARREDFAQATPRVPMRLWMRLGASREGRLLTKESEILADNGAYSLHSPSVLGAAAIRIDNLYRFEAIKSRADLVYTNTLPTQCFRGFGSPQSAFAQEQLVDDVARQLGISPIEIRRINRVEVGDETIHGWKLHSCGLGECLDAVEASIEEDRRASQAAPDAEARCRVGYGVAAGTHVISDRSINPPGDGAWARMRLCPDGRVEITSGEVEVGCGTYRVLALLAAQELNIERDTIDVVLGDTELAPFGLGSWASRTAFFAGNAVLDGARRLREILNEVAAKLELDVDTGLEELAERAAVRGLLDSCATVGEYIAEGVSPHDVSWFGNVSPSYTFGVHGAKVLVDTWTGRTRVLQYWAAHDSGTILNRPGAEGQVYGGVMQGAGYALTENVVTDARGAVLNPGFLDYRVATIADTFPITPIFVETYDPSGPRGAKNIAEPPIIPVAACIANAIFDATGVRVTRLPMEPETVYRSLSEAANQAEGTRD